MNKLTCPYMVSGVCHRKGCIYLPEQQCMKEYSKKQQKSRKHAKRG